MSYFAQVAVISDGSVVDSNNSTTTPLAGNATFTGTQWFDALSYSQVTVVAFSDQNSAVDGLQIQYSTDNGAHIDHRITTTATANGSASLQSGIHGRYVRVVYTNGASAQGAFRLQTLFNAIGGTGTIKDLDTSVRGDDNAQVTRSVLTGRVLGGSNFTDVVTDVYGSLQTVVAGQAGDSFGRVRSAAPASLFDAKFEYDTQPLTFATSLTGTGTVTKTTNESSLTLSTGGTANSAAALNQTKEYFPYEPGKSQQILMTGLLGANKDNVRSSIGYFDDNNGVFFRQDGWPNATTSNSLKGMCVVQRSNTSGSVVDTVVLQSSWNVDPMDGTGPSGVTLDFSKTQIFVIDLQWLGVGRVRYGFFVNGALITCHQQMNANVITSPYMNTAALPCRAKIENAASGVIATTTTMKQICMTVISEGGVDFPNAYEFAASNTGTSFAGVTAGNNTRTPIISIQPKATFNSLTNRQDISTLSFELANDGTKNVFWELVYNPTALTGASFVSADNNSSVNFDKSASAVTLTAGTSVVVASGFVFGLGKTPVSIPVQITRLFPLTNGINGSTPDTFTLCATGMGGTTTVWATITWQEIR